MSVSDFLNVPSLIGSALGATVFGWLGAYAGVKGKNFPTRQDVEFLRNELRDNTEITKSVEQKFSRSDVLWRGELTFRQQQLPELYGPIYGLLKSHEKLYWLWFNKQIQETNSEVINLLSMHAARIRELLVVKAHLIDGSVMPDSFRRFSTCTILVDLYVVTKQGYIPDHLSEDSPYPFDFNDEIYRVTEALKARLATLNAKYATPLETAKPASSTEALPVSSDPAPRSPVELTPKHRSLSMRGCGPLIAGRHDKYAEIYIALPRPCRSQEICNSDFRSKIEGF